MRLCRCRRLLRARPCVDGCAHAAVNILACLSARFRKLLCRLKRQLYKQAGANRQHDFQHPLRKDKVGAVSINHCFNLAFMRLFRKALFHTADILCGIPQCIILCANEQELTLDVFYLDELGFCNWVCLFGIVKKLP